MRIVHNGTEIENLKRIEALSTEKCDINTKFTILPWQS